jgi:hypothetical protein
MILTEQQKKDFEIASASLIKFLAENFHPHVKCIVDSDSSEILESSACIKNYDYIVD